MSWRLLSRDQVCKVQRESRTQKHEAVHDGPCTLTVSHLRLHCTQIFGVWVCRANARCHKKHRDSVMMAVVRILHLTRHAKATERVRKKANLESFRARARVRAKVKPSSRLRNGNSAENVGEVGHHHGCLGRVECWERPSQWRNHGRWRPFPLVELLREWKTVQVESSGDRCAQNVDFSVQDDQQENDRSS